MEMIRPERNVSYFCCCRWNSRNATFPNDCVSRENENARASNINIGIQGSNLVSLVFCYEWLICIKMIMLADSHFNWSCSLPIKFDHLNLRQVFILTGNFEMSARLPQCGNAAESLVHAPVGKVVFNLPLSSRSAGCNNGIPSKFGWNSTSVFR